VVGELHHRFRGIVGIGPRRIRGEQGDVALWGVFMREKRGRNADLIEEGVAGKGEDRADLGLPSEPAHARLTTENVGQDQSPAGRLRGELLLELGDFLESLIGHGVDQAEAEQRVNAASGHDVSFRRDDLADEVDAVEPTDSLGMEQRAATHGENGEGDNGRTEDARGCFSSGCHDRNAPFWCITSRNRQPHEVARPRGATKRSVFPWSSGYKKTRRTSPLACARRGEDDVVICLLTSS
jgi:hypothetical protein